MHNPMISVVIPIYNAEKFLKRAVESILNQFTENIELILVNDGSTDLSGNLCDKYAEENGWIKVVHKCNGGSSTARNAGINEASGEYISFLDADDFFDLETYFDICEVIEKENPDCIDFGWKYINDYGETTYNINALEKNQLLGKEIIKQYILPPLLNLKKDEKYFIYDFAVNKIYKTRIIKENSIYFDEKRRTWEDRVFLVQYLKYCNTYYSMDKYYYNYVSMPNSLSRQYDLQFFELILRNYYNYIEWFGNEYNFNTQSVHDYWCHSIENMILRSLKEKDKKEEIKRNIIRILQNEQVIIWYKCRKPQNEFEMKTSDLVVSGKREEAIRLYENAVEKERKQEKWKSIKAKLYAIRKVF